MRFFMIHSFSFILLFFTPSISCPTALFWELFQARGLPAPANTAQNIVRYESKLIDQFNEQSKQIGNQSICPKTNIPKRSHKSVSKGYKKFKSVLYLYQLLWNLSKVWNRKQFRITNATPLSTYNLRRMFDCSLFFLFRNEQL